MVKILKSSSTEAELEVGDSTVLKFEFSTGKDSQDITPLFAGTAWGAMLWDASIVLTALLEEETGREIVKDKTILELGACCGLPGLAAAVLGARTVVLTEMDEYMGVMERCVELNIDQVGNGQVLTKELTWGKENALAFVEEFGKVDLILASDCVSTDVYGRDSWEALIEVLKITCRGSVLICSVRRPGDGLDEFLELVKKEFKEHRILPVPEGNLCLVFDSLNLTKEQVELHLFTV